MTNKISVSDEFLCPILREPMSDPYITLSGHSYQKEAIEQWLLKHDTDPMTGQKLNSKLIIPNHTKHKKPTNLFIKLVFIF